MEWYRQLGFDSKYFPPGFAILRRDAVEYFFSSNRDMPRLMILGG